MYIAILFTQIYPADRYYKKSVKSDCLTWDLSNISPQNNIKERRKSPAAILYGYLDNQSFIRIRPRKVPWL
jgi:hypothetical protein